MTTYPSPSPVSTPTLSTVSVQVVGQNLTRIGLWVMNPSTTASIAICPSGLAAVINGAGSITLPPGIGIDLENFTTALNAIASAGSTPITVWEYLP